MASYLVIDSDLDNIELDSQPLRTKVQRLHVLVTQVQLT